MVVPPALPVLVCAPLLWPRRCTSFAADCSLRTKSEMPRSMLITQPLETGEKRVRIPKWRAWLHPCVGCRAAMAEGAPHAPTDSQFGKIVLNPHVLRMGCSTFSQTK